MKKNERVRWRMFSGSSQFLVPPIIEIIDCVVAIIAVLFMIQGYKFASLFVYGAIFINLIYTGFVTRRVHRKPSDAELTIVSQENEYNMGTLIDGCLSLNVGITRVVMDRLRAALINAQSIERDYLKPHHIKFLRRTLNSGRSHEILNRMDGMGRLGFVMTKRLLNQNSPNLNADYDNMIKSSITNRYSLILSVTVAMGQLGDERDIAALQDIAAGIGYSATKPELQQAAEASLVVLRARLERMKPGQNLLRASADSGELLRPAGSPCVSESDALLRPSAVDDTDRIRER